MNDLHDKLVNANDLREKGQFQDSIKEFTDCLIGYVDSSDFNNQIHTLCGHSLVYKILARKTNNKVYKLLTLSYCKAALSILEEYQTQIDIHTQSIALSSYADALFTNGQYAEAETYYERAIGISPASLPEIGRLKAHLGTTKYLLGERQLGISKIEQALSDIRTGDMNSYNVRVWETGCLNTMALIAAKENDKDKAINLVDESLSIANQFSLVIRKSEAENIKNKITSGDLNFSL